MVRRVYRAMTEEVPRERLRVSGGNSSNVEEELSRSFRIPRVGAQQPPLYNPASVSSRPSSCQGGSHLLLGPVPEAFVFCQSVELYQH